MERSLRPTVRNPLLKLAAMRKLIVVLGAHPEVKAAVLELLAELATYCRDTAQLSWRRHKAPMAVYWKVCAVYIGHTRRAIRQGGF